MDILGGEGKFPVGARNKLGSRKQKANAQRLDGTVRPSRPQRKTQSWSAGGAEPKEGAGRRLLLAWAAGGKPGEGTS